jgi:hypothetical protein
VSLQILPLAITMMIALLALLALRNYVKRETIEPPSGLESSSRLVRGRRSRPACS